MTASKSENLQKRLEIAVRAAQQAAKIQRECYQTDVGVQIKSSDVDLVTVVDRQCDELISRVLEEESGRAGLPSATMITEESFEEGTFFDMEQSWVVDPLDGTTNYAHAFPHFAVSIAFMQKGQPMAGVIYDTMKDELFTAVRGSGAFLNGRKISVSAIDDLERSLLATGFPYDRHVKPEDNMGYFLTFMMKCHGVRRAGSAALDLAYVASGRLDGFWELRLSPWDVAAGSLLVEEAGGRITDFAGKPLKYDVRRINIIGSNTALHDPIVEICQASPAPCLSK